MLYNKLFRKSSTSVRVIVAIIMVILFLFPIYYILQMSLKNQVDAFAYPPIWIFKPTFDNFMELFREESFFKYLGNSVIISVLCVTVSIVLGAPAAYALSRLKVRWVNTVLFSILAIRMIPPMSILLPIFSIYVKLRIVDTYLGVTLLYLTFILPLVVWMMKSFFDDIPISIEEAAIIDGCSIIQAFIRVAMPIVAQATASVAIFAWILSWNEFLYALIITRENAKTATVVITSFMRFEDFRWGIIAAAAIVISTPVIIFGILVRKYLVSGLTAGAIKE